jgi:hypothetical protein
MNRPDESAVYRYKLSCRIPLRAYLNKVPLYFRWATSAATRKIPPHSSKIDARQDRLFGCVRYRPFLSPIAPISKTTRD